MVEATKAAVRTRYGPPHILRIAEVDKPIPRANEVLIRVHAASVNRSDCHVLSGSPFAMRLFTGLFTPRRAATGTDFAGQVEATGSAVKSFSTGDRVMGFGGVFGIGSHAQYITFPETRGIVRMPGNVSYEEAAACLEGAVYAAMGILHLKPSAGRKALVNGATGAIGSSYVQFLKHLGASVTAVCPGEQGELVRSLGADRIIDYRTEDFTTDDERYDFVFDAVGKSTFVRCRPILKDAGIYTSSGGFENLFWALVTPVLGGKRVLFLSPGNINASLRFITELIEGGHFRPVIDKVYTLENIAEAFAYVATGQKIGNVIVSMDA